MELSVIPKGSKYLVLDARERQLYTIKKKGFGYKYIIYDASNYALYTLSGDFSDKHPIYLIHHDSNPEPYFWIKCKSRFLDPSMVIKSETGEYLLTSDNKKDFTLKKDGVTVGELHCNTMPNGDLCYALTLDDRDFDDAWPFLALCVESSFIRYNK